MDYQQTIDYLFSRLPMFSRIGAAAYKADLTNTIALCALLGNPERKFKSIHIAGTNGKGSTSHMLAAIFQQAGYKTGLYTSPHLVDFRERIRINGEMISEAFVISFTEQMRAATEKIEPSFFELTVAMAFRYFEQEKVDIAIIETGLGGRLDSTNVIMPELSIITNIGFDHMQLLGNTLTAIAGEKAGIIKHAVPVVIGQATDETLPVFKQKATEEAAPLCLAQEHYQVSGWNWEGRHLLIQTEDAIDYTIEHWTLDLPGIYQLQNLLTVLTACDILQRRGWNISHADIQAALQQVIALTGLHGRWEQIHDRPAIILDVAHNEDGIRQVIRQLAHTPFRHLHIVTGMVKDKDLETVLSLLPADASYYFTRANIPRALPETTLREMAVEFNLNGQSYADVNTAIAAALAVAAADDLILVCGSVFLVGEVDRKRFGS